MKLLDGFPFRCRLAVIPVLLAFPLAACLTDEAELAASAEHVTDAAIVFELEANVSGSVVAAIVQQQTGKHLSVAGLVAAVNQADPAPVAWLLYPESQSSQPSSYEAPRIVGSRETVNGIEFYGITVEGEHTDLEAIVWRNDEGRNHFALGLESEGHGAAFYNAERTCTQCHQGGLPIVEPTFTRTSNVTAIQDQLLVKHPSGSYAGIAVRTLEPTAQTFRMHVLANARMAHARQYWSRLCSDAPGEDAACKRHVLAAGLALVRQAEDRTTQVQDVTAALLAATQLGADQLKTIRQADAYYTPYVDNGFFGASNITLLYKNHRDSEHFDEPIIHEMIESALYGVGFTSADQRALLALAVEFDDGHVASLLEGLDDALFDSGRVDELRKRILGAAGVAAAHLAAIGPDSPEVVLTELQPNANVAGLLPNDLKQRDVYVEGMEAFDQLCATCHLAQPRNAYYLERGMRDASRFVRFGGVRASVDDFQLVMEQLRNYGGYHTSIGTLKNYLGEKSDAYETMPTVAYMDTYMGGRALNEQKLKDLKAMLILDDRGVPAVQDDFAFDFDQLGHPNVACTYGSKATSYKAVGATLNPTAGGWTFSYVVDSYFNADSPGYQLIESQLSIDDRLLMKRLNGATGPYGINASVLAEFLNVIVKPRSSDSWAIKQCSGP